MHRKSPQNIGSFKNKIWVNALGFWSWHLLLPLLPLLSDQVVLCPCWVDYVNYKGTKGFVSPTEPPTKSMDKKNMIQSVRGLSENMPKARREDVLISTKELHRKLSQWPLATSHKHVLLMTLAAFWEFKMICLLSFVRELILSQEA